MSGDLPQYPSYPGNDGESTPPPGNLPPPPPPPGPSQGQAPPPAYGSPPPGFPPPPGTGSELSYASWGARLGAYLLDTIFAILALFPLIIVGGVIAGITGEGGEFNPDTGLYEGGTVSPLSTVFVVLGYVAYFVFFVWNWGVRQGRTGQTLGKGIVNIRVVRESAFGTPLGFWLSIGRSILFSIITTCTLYINALWPLWDSKRQALHDKAVNTVVIKT